MHSREKKLHIHACIQIWFILQFRLIYESHAENEIFINILPSIEYAIKNVRDIANLIFKVAS